MLISRLITALILIPCVIASLFLLPLTSFSLIVIGVCMLAAWEWGQFAGFRSPVSRVMMVTVIGIGLFLLQYLFPTWQQMAALLWIALVWWIVALFMVITYPQSAALWRQSHLLRLLFGLLTLVPFFCGMLVLRHYHYDDDSTAGAWWLLFVMLLVWSADSGAYMFGRLFGKHKLAPRVSPGKTWEGFIGGLFTAGIIAFIFSLLVPLTIPTMTLLICSVTAALASVLGDLTESMFKREAGLKDSGRLIPGHGGVLDRIDSLTAAIPVFSCLLLLIFGAA
ncbi:MAG: Phosphatidate cytidylyltransferase [Candidatus Erwinia impunctatus]|nr:Phosphatidate cytidylyltransferase [Culicoides impunctatus]